MKKMQQLGMNPSTASGRLVKDLLWSFIVSTENNKCFHCGKPMTRENFSIEHKIPWLDSEDPVSLFFDIENISYSHHSCNVKAARKPREKNTTRHGTSSMYKSGCRCDSCVKHHKDIAARNYTSEKRKAQYARTGK